MSFINCFYNQRTSKMHLWEEIRGERFHDVVDWTPYVFLKTQQSEIKTIYGEPVVRKDFENYQEYKEFTEGNPDALEDKVKPEIQYLAERYHHIPDDELEVPKLRIYTLDIEVLNSKGFPSIWEAFPL